ncbi:nicotinate-nucleotide--dimethylbenzimidazole phosphoribosyltransferase [Lentilactobacillus fungorum]|uniref:Nicotinate-nucleotide--dimethylbenzimidazole phosphoribosyltransferase n=1 Tax=Lentilactobacillus fungorum TaxID=2201250 RepID=A0ABQ3W040_9LACO|nr:nicotinate-nucleotide--dimethylbenzimidazole phosphoribosyltransferase [Lentilactobacillus fungorum]GHP13964.1 nicotinate-nucleotide--dimethylbenzimidazole phosphoribosyltransferase [Lentilactobacillus fungorum]
MLEKRTGLKPISEAAIEEMQTKLDHKCKPIGGLGKLEILADKLAGIEGTVDIQTGKRVCLVFAADHGVEREGVSATPRNVTALQAVNMMAGNTTVAAIAKANRCAVQVIDVGIDADVANSKVLNRKIRRGTTDMLQGPAMTRKEAEQSIQIGYDVASQAIDDGNQVLAIGELGIANTTASSAIIAVMLNEPVASVVGRGSNISDQRLQHKADVIEAAIAKWRPDAADPIDVLSKVGGFEIGGKVGAMICAAQNGVPLIMDGFISEAALTIAEGLYPGISQHLIASHASKERGTQLVMQRYGLDPLLELNMAVGEGSGAVLVLSLIDAVQSILKNMNTLEDLDVFFTK